MAQTMKAKILVVDDDVSIRGMYAEILEDEGYEVTTASDGQDALRQLGGVQVKAVLVDMMMPGMDGLELCRQLRQADDTRLLPIILISAGPNVVGKAKEVQANAVLVKPFDLDNLLRLVDKVVVAEGAGTEDVIEHGRNPFSGGSALHVDCSFQEKYYERH